MISNNSKYYEILFEQIHINGSSIYYVGNLSITNKNEVRISEGVPFFYCAPTYCFEFSLNQLVFICYFELFNEEITVKVKQDGYCFSFRNMLLKQPKEFELPILIKRMLYKWNVIDTGVSIITTSDGIVKTATKCFITNAKLLYKTKIYEICAKCLEFGRTIYIKFKIVCETDQKPFIDTKYKELCIVSHDNPQSYYSVRNINDNGTIMFFKIKNNNYLEIMRLDIYYSDMYWISYDIGCNTFICPFKLNGFNLEFQDKKSTAKLSTRSPMERILKDFQNAKNPITMENINEIAKKYVIYYGNQKVAKLYMYNQEIRLYNESNYLFYNGVTYNLYFRIQEKDEIILVNEYKILIEKNQLTLIKKPLENNKNLLECELMCTNGKLTVLSKEFSAIITKIGLAPLKKFGNLKQSRNQEFL